VSRSQLSTLMFEGPEEFHSKHILKEQPGPSSDAIDIGEVSHQILLRGRIKNKVARLIPDEVLRKDKNGRLSRAGAEWESFAASCAVDGVIPLLQRDWRSIDRIVDQVWKNDIARQMIEKASRKEATCEWQDEETGLLCRVMFDVFAPSFRADLKTTSKPVREATIAKHIGDMHYDIQAAFYERAAKLLGATKDRFVFIFQKNDPPYTCRCFDLTKDDLDVANARITKYLRQLADRLEKDDWSSDKGQLTTVSLPSYIKHLDQWSP